MSYLVLARKYRPRCFSEVVGQGATVRTLQNGLLQNRVAHALIFSGVRGTGKTTLARIMAKALNCENRKGAEPCDTCASCKQIADGSSVDLQEVDGASNRGIQEIRELKDNIRFMPTSSRYKIIIIDEVHMLTTEAFNALLKTLEEPPDHVFFMFATTELHKVPLTILSRCQRYELTRISREELTRHFARLTKEEQVTIEPAALEMIVREAGGSVRDGLSLLDQVFSYCGDQVTTQEVVDLLGVVNTQTVANVIDALLQKDLATVFGLLDNIYTQGVDFKRLSSELLGWSRNLVVCKIGAADNVLDLAEEDMTRLQATADGQTLETLTALFNLLLEGLEKAHYSDHSRLNLELTFLKIFQSGNVVAVQDLISRFDNLISDLPTVTQEQVNAVPLQKVTARQASVPPVEEVSPVPVAEAPVLAKEPVAATEERAPAVEQEIQPEPSSLAKSDEPQQPVELSPEKSSFISDDQQEVPESTPRENKDLNIRRDWDTFLAYVKKRQAWMAASLQLATSIKVEQDELVIHFDDSVNCSMLRQNQYIKPLTEYLLDFFQKSLTVRFVVPEGQSCDVDGENGQKAHEERKALANDPLVITAIEIFNGQVGDIRTGPRFRNSVEEDAPQEKAAEEQQA